MTEALPQNTVAVIVTYYPDSTHLLRLIERVQKQVCDVIVVNNTPSDRLDLPDEPGLVVLNLEKNIGLAAAQNRGIKMALDKGAQFVLLLDQDSLPQEDMIEQLQTHFNALSARGERVAAIGPRLRDRQTKKVADFFTLNLFPRTVRCQPGQSVVKSGFVIASGSFISKTALLEIGLMDSDLFIDHIDTEWAFRAQKQGWEIYGACRAQLNHSIGEHRLKIWLGRWRELPIHKPFRYFYIFRNSLWLAKMPHVRFGWALQNLTRNLVTLGILLITQPNRRAIWREAWRGIRSGFGQADKGDPDSD